MSLCFSVYCDVFYLGTILEKECTACSEEPIQILKKPLNKHNSIFLSKEYYESKNSYLICDNCGKIMCMYCAKHICSLINITSETKFTDKKNIHKDIWYSTVSDIMKDCNISRHVIIPYGNCCSFSVHHRQAAVIPTCTLPNMSKSNDKHEKHNTSDQTTPSNVWKLPNQQFNKKTISINSRKSEISSSDCDRFFLNQIRKKLYSEKVTDFTSLNYLHKYHETDDGSCPRRWNGGRKIIPNNKLCSYEGDLYIPTHGIIIRSQTSNNYLRTEIIALAKSDYDGTKPIPHGNISQTEACSLKNFLLENNKSLKKLPNKLKYNDIIHNVPSPENSSKMTSWKVQVIEIPQIVKSDIACKKKGNVLFNVEKLAECYGFGEEDVESDVDVTIIIGNLSLENVKTPKLLMLKFSDMIQSEIKDDDASDLYNYLRSLSGRHGFEIRQTSGTAGPVNLSSDYDFLQVLKHMKSSVPRKIDGTVIICDKLCYYIFIKNVKTTLMIVILLM